MYFIRFFIKYSLCLGCAMFFMSCQKNPKLPITTNGIFRNTNTPPAFIIYFDQRGAALIPIIKSDEPICFKDIEIYQIIIALWKDGTIIWSDNRICGGSPYKIANISFFKVDKFMKSIEELKIQESNIPLRHSGPDAAYTVIRAVLKNQEVEMASWHDAEEKTRDDVVGTSYGLQFIGKGKTRESILAREPKEYLEFLRIWNEVFNSALSLIPDKGVQVQKIDILIED
jgi:hypothetical protein